LLINTKIETKDIFVKDVILFESNFFDYCVFLEIDVSFNVAKRGGMLERRPRLVSIQNDLCCFIIELSSECVPSGSSYRVIKSNMAAQYIITARKRLQ
jgi:hypothetical protein